MIAKRLISSSRIRFTMYLEVCIFILLTFYALWQAAKCPGVISRSAGMLSAQAFPAFGHLVRNGQPDGGFKGLGTSPSSRIRFLAAERSGSAMGIAERSISV